MQRNRLWLVVDIGVVWSLSFIVRLSSVDATRLGACLIVRVTLGFGGFGILVIAVGGGERRGLVS